MSEFDEWCNKEDKEVNGQDLTLLTTDDDRAVIGLEAVAAIVPAHYVSGERYARILDRLGKPGAAAYLRDKLPKSKKTRSGDLGEIIAISYIEEQTVWDQTVMKLRWKDHREMAMRGDDLLAVGIDDENKTQFLKGESKSRATLSAAPITAARAALNKDDGRPTPHALSFLADRLYEEGREEIADRIDKAQYVDGIYDEQISHMIFTFSGNDPTTFLETDLNNYTGNVYQFSVGLRIGTHQTFIKDVFDKVSANGDA